MATEIGMTLLYVRDVRKATAFYQKAFGIELDPSVPATREGQPPAMEVLFTVKNVGAAYERAVGAGALALREPADKPWGQRVAYVRDTDGFVVELASPLAR